MTKVYLIFAASIVIGITLNWILFYRNPKTRFIESEELWGFVLQIIIAIVGFGLTLVLSNQTERAQDKSYVVEMLEQSSDFTANRLALSSEYTEEYQDKRNTWEDFSLSNKITFDYYDNLFSNSQVMEYLDMNAYGHMLQYLLWAKDLETMALEESDINIAFDYYKTRDEHLFKMDKIVQACCEELEGNMSKEELTEYIVEIKNEQYDLKIDQAEEK